MTATLPGTFSTIELGGGVRITAPGVTGVAQHHEVDGPSDFRAAEAEGSTDALRDVLADAGLRTTHVVELEIFDVDQAGAEDAGTRSASGETAMVLEVPDEGEDVGQVVLAVDEHGAATWVFPSAADGEPKPQMRGVGDTLTFNIRTTVPEPGPDDSGERGLLGVVGRKVLKVLAWPIVEKATDWAAKELAERFENRRRPVRVRTFLPGDQRDQSINTPPDWQHLASGPSLWFVHGTFSTATNGFGAIGTSTLRQLHEAYGGRVVAYDHHTLHVTPEENVSILAGLVPDGLTFDADLVGHSRGGLVCRALSGEGLPDGVTSPLNVRKVVTVATPHHGTALADPQHLTSYLDRVTTMLNLAPDGIVVADALAVVVDVVKVVLAKGLAALPGLVSMDPTDGPLPKLNAAAADTGIQLHAMAANHEPQGPLRSLVVDHAADAFIDRVFRGEENDVVVPTAGAWTGSEGPLFPVPEERRLVLDASAGVKHSTFFSKPQVREALLRWLG